MPSPCRPSPGNDTTQVVNLDCIVASREEVFVAVAGRALVVPAGRPFSLANPSTEPFRAVVALPAGGRAAMPGQAPFVPPWAE
jgi:uncharacterized RmlC-like cupin family protein